MQKKGTPQELLEKVTKNKTGFIDKIPTVLDYVQGLETGIVYEATNPSGDWTDYLPAPERQFSKYADYLACTSFSHLNVRETRFNYMLKHNLYPEHVVKFLNDNGYIAADGKVNFSDRYVAKLANTNVSPPGPGAALPTVAEVVRNFGIVPESAWPTNENMTWQEYYAEIPQSVLDLGKKSLEYFKFLYEWVDISLALVDEPLGEETFKAIKQSPLQITIPIPCYHATMLYFAEVKIPDGEQVKIFDTYDPFYFEGDRSYPIYYSMKLVEVVKQVETAPVRPSYTFTRNLKYSMSGPDVEMLQKILKYEGDFTLSYTTEYFGVRTKQALQAYQKRNGIPATGNFWDITRGNINDKYAPNAQPKKKALE